MRVIKFICQKDNVEKEYPITWPITSSELFNIADLIADKFCKEHKCSIKDVEVTIKTKRL